MIIKILLFFLLTIYHTFVDAADWQKNCQQSQCYAIVDAGSSGSRFYIYSHDYQILYSKRIEPGLSTVALSSISSYFDKLMPEPPLVSIPTYVYGTAGMRLLKAEQQRQHYQAVSSWFAMHPAWNLIEARTILGKEEGVFAWLAVLNQNKQKNAVLEIGGASVQVNIPVDANVAKTLDSQDISEFNIAGQKIYLWTKSYLGLGLNEVEKRVMNDAFCFSQNYPLKTGELGSGDMSQCITHLETNENLALLSQLSAAKNILQRQSLLTWVALGAIRYSVSTPPYQFREQFNLKELRQTADTMICHENWGALIQKYTDFYTYRQCLAASYYYASMVDAIGINENQSIVYPSEKQNFDWTLGALLFNQNKS